jgi:para-nitrobenzyl esterase
MQADRRVVLGGAAALTALAAAGPVLAADGPEAATAYGRVRGEVEDGINVFRGIPYGAPTGGGGARFQAPKPPKPWNGVRETTKFGDQCPQTAFPGVPVWASWARSVGTSEDCLSVNVWTPGLRDGVKRPVMVWMHGGGFSLFNGSSPAYDGVRLAKRGDVVVVTLNHRLNAFGYLYLAEIGGAEFADSGNVGQLDLIEALKWVKDNIAEFGGDPGRVTIFGESGGGAKVSTLLAMPAAKGLFHRAIIQSGPGLTGLTPAAATKTAKALMEAIGAGGAGDLQRAPYNRIVDGLEKLNKAGMVDFGPVVDGKNLPRDPFTPDAPAITADVPVIVGYNATETTILFPPPGAFDLDWAGLKTQLTTAIPGADADKVIADFRRLRPSATASDIYFNITTLHWMGAGSWTLAERKSALGQAAAYLYRVEFQTSVGRLRSPHALEIPLVFDTVGKSASLLGPVAADAQLVADQMSAAWIAFARTGSPNAPGLASWPRYDTRSRSTMIFNVTSRAVNDPYAEERQIIAALPPPPQRG